MILGSNEHVYVRLVSLFGDCLVVEIEILLTLPTFEFTHYTGILVKKEKKNKGNTVLET